MNPAHWRPREMFNVSNVLIAQQPSTWVFTYVTGPQDEPVDLRFATGSSSPLRVSNISLWRAAALPRTPNPYREISQNDGIVVLENSAAMPRARFAAKLTRVHDYIDARNRLWDADRPFDPRQETLVEGEPPAQSPSLSTGSVDRLTYSPNHATLETHRPAMCYLVLADLFLPVGRPGSTVGPPGFTAPTLWYAECLCLPARIDLNLAIFRDPSSPV